MRSILLKKIFLVLVVVYFAFLIVLYYANSIPYSYISKLFNSDVSFLHVFFSDIFTNNNPVSDWKIPGAPGFLPDFVLFTIPYLLFDDPRIINFIYSGLQMSLILVLAYYLYKLIVRENYTDYFILFLLLFSLFLLATVHHHEISRFSFFLLSPSYHTNVLITSMISFILVYLFFIKMNVHLLILLSIVIFISIVSDKIFIISFVLPILCSLLITSGVKHWKLLLVIFFSGIAGYWFAQFIMPQFLFQSKQDFNFNFDPNAIYQDII